MFAGDKKYYHDMNKYFLLFTLYYDERAKYSAGPPRYWPHITQGWLPQMSLFASRIMVSATNPVKSRLHPTEPPNALPPSWRCPVNCGEILAAG
jgi:hypothetical protein